MKNNRILLLTLFVASLAYGQAPQSKAPWRIKGNDDVDQNSFIGSLIQAPLIFKTNNQERMIISETGEISMLGLMRTDYGVKMRTGLILEPDLVKGGGRIYSENGDVGINNMPDFHFNTIFHCQNKGNVGIGLCNPTNKFEVLGHSKFTGNLNVTGLLKVGTNSLYLGSNTSGSAGVQNFIYTDNGPLKINSDEGQGAVQNTWINPDGGKIFVGMGENHPDLGANPGGWNTVIKHSAMLVGKAATLSFRGAALDAAGNVTGPSPNYNGDVAIEILESPGGEPDFNCTNPYKGLNFWRPYPNTGGHGNFDLFISCLQGNAGNVGIGTPYPVHKLTVNGTMGARRVIVETTAWCDFVFKPDYKLMSLDERKSFIEKEGHLPYMASEEKVTTDGVDVNDAITGLLHNTEDITLYLLQMNKRLEALQQENQELKKRLEVIENQK